MTNKKISALVAATTPLVGTELIPIVQAGATDNVSVSNLTAGRVVLASGLGVNTSSPQGTVSLGSSAGGLSGITLDWTGGGGPYAVASYQADRGTGEIRLGAYTNFYYTIYSNGIARLSFSVAGDATLNTGNLVQGTSAKGINFTANTPAAGMTSQLLNWYEEGTWTPTISGFTTVGVQITRTGTYTRIGRLVYLRGIIVYATSIANTGAATITSTGMPFIPARPSANGGVADDGTGAPIGSVSIFASGTMYFVPFTARAGIDFSITYEV